MKYNQETMIRIAKRDNNQKRPFLLVNPLQGKHLPVSPSQALALFQTLGRQVFASAQQTEPIFVIGFAETATAIGAGLAASAPFPVHYIHTTRETHEHCEYLYFSEAHSHATEQKLVKNYLDKHLSGHAHIIFAEDEVTTGNTIENILKLLLKTYPECQLRFSVASLLNGMSKERLEHFSAQGIDCYYLSPVPAFDYAHILSEYQYEDERRKIKPEAMAAPADRLYLDGFVNPRLGTDTAAYLKACQALSDRLTGTLSPALSGGQQIAIIGTEECMYPGLLFGQNLELKTGCPVFFHATTRSPILPSGEKGYPVKERFQLTSFYEESRITYLYNLKKYDKVYIITDSSAETSAADFLCGYLREYGCQDITVVSWKEYL